MKKQHEYCLELLFRTKARQMIYDGQSYYTKRVVDRAVVAENRICIIGKRSTRKSVQDFVFSPQSTFRFQFYRAVCYYLSVRGKLPPVKEIVFTCDGEQQSIAKERLVKHWNQCNLDVLLNQDTAARCFAENGFQAHIAITYFIKAQIDAFSHDCFRAAWSGLNSLYTMFGNTSSSENEMLTRLNSFLCERKPVQLDRVVASLPDEFWKGLNWYAFTHQPRRDNKKLVQELFESLKYRDEILYRRLSDWALRDLLTSKDAQKHEQGLIYEQKRDTFVAKKKLQDKPNERLRFLICQYCYMLRNNSFHANRPYPVFGLFSDEAESEQRTLTRLILLTIRYMMIHYDDIERYAAHGK